MAKALEVSAPIMDPRPMTTASARVALCDSVVPSRMVHHGRVTSAASDTAVVARPGVGRPAALDPTLLRLLGDPLRAHIITLLAGEQLCTCHLVELTGARQTNISNHLRALRDAGVVTASPHGRFTYYRLETAALRSLGAALDRLADAADGAAERRRPCS